MQKMLRYSIKEKYVYGVRFWRRHTFYYAHNAAYIYIKTYPPAPLQLILIVGLPLPPWNDGLTINLRFIGITTKC